MPPSDENMCVPSPCIGLCQMDADSGWCKGCQRTIDEISQWASASDEVKRMIWRQLQARRQREKTDTKT